VRPVYFPAEQELRPHNLVEGTLLRLTRHIPQEREGRMSCEEWQRGSSRRRCKAIL